MQCLKARNPRRISAYDVLGLPSAATVGGKAMEWNNVLPLQLQEPIPIRVRTNPYPFHPQLFIKFLGNMVSTRGHPKDFPEPDLSPSKQVAMRGRKGKWAHTPSNLTLIWLMISLPLVIWDTGYVLLRPHSMPGGWLHWPIWSPYGLYGKVDYIYGWKAFDAHNGFTAAQGLLNLIETIVYLYYLYILYTYGTPSPAPGRGAPKSAKVGFLGEQRYLTGKMAGVAVMVLYSGAMMTLSKTVLYCMTFSILEKHILIVV
jgi:hypothetical protein